MLQAPSQTTLLLIVSFKLQTLYLSYILFYIFKDWAGGAHLLPRRVRAEPGSPRQGHHVAFHFPEYMNPADPAEAEYQKYLNSQGVGLSRSPATGGWELRRHMIMMKAVNTGPNTCASGIM